MKIAMISQWYGANSFRWLSNAFEHLGHKVERYGPTFPNHMGVPWGRANDYMAKSNSTFPAHERDVDLVIVNDWAELRFEHDFSPRKLVLIEPEGWPWSFTRRDELKPDVAYHAQPYGIPQHPYDPSNPERSCEEDGWKWLPGACDPSVHPMLYMERDYDFAMMATPYKWRPALCQYLREHGFTVRADFGNVADYALGYNRSLFTAESSDGQEYIKWRVFEAMAMGCVVLHTPCRLMERLFEDRKHYYVVPHERLPDGEPNGPRCDYVAATARDLKEIMPTVRLAADAARREVLSKHCYRHRAEQILRDVGMIA